jgi:hypothetical protein
LFQSVSHISFTITLKKLNFDTEKSPFLFCHFKQPGSAEKDGIARGLSEHPVKGGEFRSARPFRAAQGSLTQSNQVIGGPFFWFVFFGQAKKMNV